MKAIIAGLLAAASGCATDDVPVPVDQSSGHAGPAYLEVQFTDTSDALAQWQGARPKLVVDIGRVELRHASGVWTTVSGAHRQLDLLAVEGGNTSVISSSILPPGGYSEVRVVVDSATLIVPDQAPQSLAVEGSIVEVPAPTDLSDTMSYALVLDFNTVDSMVSASPPALSENPPSQPLALYEMVPAISLYSMGQM